MQIPAVQKLPHSQHGVALITALLVVSLATILAVSLVSHLYYDIRRTENILRLDQARLYNANALEFGMSLLRQDRIQNNEYDTLLEYSINNEQAYPVEGGQVFAKITEQQGCFNLNNLSKTAAELAKNRSLYTRLLNSLSIDVALQSTLVDSLVDWLDADDISEPQGAEFDYYIGLDIPYRTANTLMYSPSELRLVKGYSADVIERLGQHVCALPAINTGININTASAEVLDSIEGLSKQGARIVNDRDGTANTQDDDSPFIKIEDFTAYVKSSLKVNNLNPKGLQIYSEYFLLESGTQLGAGDIRQYNLIYRNQSDGKTKLIRKTGGAL
ncbi:General secretion pathway protein K [hydrothermal vent metagenome]|uniref:General secretion pathway protein K n=1 Tax=hydrothermal vent metagenome TaxID=652676 RepID=A0A3B0Y5N9_9ZZZZ